MRQVLLAVLILMVGSGAAVAQDCTISAYADPAGTSSYMSISAGRPASFYVVMFAEDTVGAVAYSLTISGQYTMNDLFVQGRFTGPSGNGLVIDESTGTNAALGECVVGFGGHPVLVDEYVIVQLYSSPAGIASRGPSGSFIEVEPNTSQDPDFPQYVNCGDVTKDCTPVLGLWVDGLIIPTESRSFGAIKSLFNKD